MSFTAPRGATFACVNVKETKVLYSNIFEQQVYHGLLNGGGDVVIDVGANVGVFAKYAAECCPDSEVWCYEPVPSLEACLRQNTRPQDKVFTKLTPLSEACKALVAAQRRVALLKIHSKCAALVLDAICEGLWPLIDTVVIDVHAVGNATLTRVLESQHFSVTIDQKAGLCWLPGKASESEVSKLSTSLMVAKNTSNLPTLLSSRPKPRSKGQGQVASSRKVTPKVVNGRLARQELGAWLAEFDGIPSSRCL